MTELGIIECFFGPAWPHADRLSLAPFMRAAGGCFYVYAPKSDATLRREWRRPADYSRVKELSGIFRAEGIRFGVGLSPWAWKGADGEVLKRKVAELNAVGIDILGLFFDDMPSSEKMAEAQVKAVEIARAETSARIAFCPSYYSYDPVLDRAFGDRPKGYLETIGAELPADIDILWTGPRVISPEVSSEHLLEINGVLQRPPFICDNLYANDGPKNCKFLKIAPFLGRPRASLRSVAGWGLNLMNQPALSRIVFLAASLYAREACEPEEAIERAIRALCSHRLADAIATTREACLKRGLDRLVAEERAELLAQFASFKPEPAADDIVNWLLGHYNVGDECLTD